MEVLVYSGHILFGGVFVLLGVNNLVKLEIKTAKASAKKVPFAKLSVIFTTLMIIVGGISVMADFQARIGGILLIAFLIPATLIFHDFWRAENPETKEADMIHFCKNIAMIGAVLTFLGMS